MDYDFEHHNPLLGAINISIVFVIWCAFEIKYQMNAYSKQVNLNLLRQIDLSEFNEMLENNE